MSTFCSVDLRNYDERELEDSCTFKPALNSPNPFISERTLRKYSQQRRRNAPPPPPGGELGDKPLLTKHGSFKRRTSLIMQVPMGGMYSKNGGFGRCAPPAAGIPLFAFDPFCPPNFAMGKYGREVVVEDKADAEPTVQAPAPPAEDKKPEEGKRSSKLAAPPLPPWLNNPTSAKSGGEPAAPRKLVIQKVAKKETEEAPQGWQAVLAEMTVKRAAMKNKPPPVKKEVEKKAPMKRIESGKKVKKKPEDFKDIMDELAYKFAVLRGDIKEDDKGDEEEQDAPKEETKTPAAPAARKSLKGAEVPTESPANPARKVTVKPDLAAMLAKVKSPAKPAEAPAIRLGPPPAAAAAAAAPPVPAGPPAKIAVAKPARIPGAPPVPSTWQPVPFKAPPGQPSAVSAAPPIPAPGPAPVASSSAPADTKKDPSERRSGERKTVVQQQDLPEGYYMAATKEDTVEPYGILRKGDTTVDLIMKLTEMVARADEMEQHENAAAAERDRSGFEAADPATVMATRKLTISDLPTPASFAAAIQRMKRSHELRQAAHDLEQQMEYRNYDHTPTRQRSTTPYAPNSSMASSSSTPTTVSFFTDKYFENKSQSFRRAAESSHEDCLPLSRRLEATGRGGAYSYQDANLSTTHWLKTLRSNDPPLQSPRRNMQMAASTNSSISDTLTKGSNNPHDNYLQQLRSPTESRGPQLRSEDVLSRRQAVRIEKDAMLQQHDRESAEAVRKRKEHLHQLAMETARATGTYRPPDRLSSHRKMIEKYNMRPDVGMDLAAMTSRAYDQYSSQLLSPEYSRSQRAPLSQYNPYSESASSSYYPPPFQSSVMQLGDLLDEYDE